MIRDILGQGGMGIVFLAEQSALGRTVAIKVLDPAHAGDPGIVRQFRDEAIAASRVRHPRSVHVIDCGVHEGMPYLVMEHVRGRPLGRVIAEEMLPLPRVLELVRQILGTVAAVHAAGIVHADLKSDNFLVDEVDGADHVTMIDFGLARRDEDTYRFDGCLVSGTPEYMAPELIRGDRPSRASDLYAIGVILYELLTGTTPFTGTTATEIMTRQLEDLVVPPSLRQPHRELPPMLDQIVLRALAKRPELRFPDAAAFARALELPRYTRRVPVHDAPPSPREQQLRRAIGEALVRGDVTRIAEGYLALAMALAHEQRFSAAANELEEGIDVLSAGRGPGAAGAPHAVGPLVVALAALYDDAGQREHARRMARSIDRHPTYSDAAPPARPMLGQTACAPRRNPS